MTYKSIKEIEEAYAARAGESKAEQDRRVRSKRQAITRFKNNQQSSSQSHSRTTTGATARKQKSRANLTSEQRTSVKDRNKIEQQTRYTAQQEQLREQFSKIGCCNIEDYVESVIE